MKPARLILLVVALLAGGLAAVLATAQREPPPVDVETVTEFVAEPRTRILVARDEIGMGQRLTSQLVEWVDWPQERLRADYVTVAAAPDAVDDMSGAVARFEFFEGEPIREAKLARADQGYLSAVLEAGKRGVSVSVSAESASGGFIVPNDHVDVVLTRAAGEVQLSETILSNVRVLAINARLGETGETGAPADPADPRAEVFVNQAIATLELDPTQAEVIINATSIGRLSLVLRAMVDYAQSEEPTPMTVNQAIRLSSRFWSK